MKKPTNPAATGKKMSARILVRNPVASNRSESRPQLIIGGRLVMRPLVDR